MTPEQAESRTILKILAGSHIHGLNVETSDRDEEAIILEPLDEAFGMTKPFEDLIREGKTTGTGVDVKYVSLRKWCQLACKGNPNFLLMLFAPSESILSMDARGRALREMAPLFICRQAIQSHLGYMQGQRNRMLNHQKEFFDSKAEETFGRGAGRGKPRFDLIAQYGYDTKFAMHLLRLGMQGVEIAEHGRITLPMSDAHRASLLDVRHGRWTLQDVLTTASELENRMKAALDSSTLRVQPDYATIETWMCRQYVETWAVEDRMQRQFEDYDGRGVDIRRH